MRYIKTKDGIYEVSHTDVCWRYAVGSGEIVDKSEVYVCKNGDKIPFNQVLAEADTPEELCDGFYLDDGQEEFCLDDVFTNFDKFKSSYIYNNKYHIVKYEGYGFIKTSKGLIYVAKMNEKGDLRLI